MNDERSFSWLLSFYYLIPSSMVWLMIVGLLGMFVYKCEVWDVESPPLYAEVSLLIGQGVFGHAGAFWVEERELPSAESKCPVRRDVSGYDRSRPKFGRMAISLFVHYWCSVVVGQSSAEWPFPFVQRLAFNECPPIKSGRMVISLYLLDAESVLFVVSFVVLLGRYPCCIITFICVLFFTNISCFLNLQQKTAKKRKSAACYFISYFGMNWIILH